MSRDLFVHRAATAVTLLCVAAVVGSLLLLAVPGLRRTLGLGERPAYVVGDRIDVPGRLYETAPITLLLFARSDCSACQRAQPALASAIKTLSSQSPAHVALLVNQGTEDREQQFLHDLGLDASQLTAIDFGSLRLQDVPTAVLVDRDGRIRYSVEGEPQPADYQELLRIAAMARAAG